MKTRIALLGFGKVGQTLVNSIDQDPSFERFEIHSIWNRSHTVFEGKEIPNGTVIYKNIEQLISDLAEVDMVVECAHPNVLLEYGSALLKHCSLFVSSPTAFAKDIFRTNIIKQVSQNGHHCYVPLGASVGVWDIIRLDQMGLIKELTVTMSKHPSAFKIKDEETVDKLTQALSKKEGVEIASANVAHINGLAPQNTNTMSIYAMAASTLGFQKCTGKLIADSLLDSHIVHCNVETHTGLNYTLIRDNPAQHGAVTGSATFGSFLNSLKNFDKGLKHGCFTFC